MSRVLAISILALLCVLAGCDDRENLIKAPNGLKVVPVVYLGTQLHIEHLGTTIFTDANSEIDISSWHMDEYVKAAAIKALNSSPKYRVVEAGDDTAARNFIEHHKVTFLTPDSRNEDALSLIELGKKSGADMVLVIDYLPNEDHHRYHMYLPYGIQETSLVGIHSGGYVLFNAWITLINVATGKMVTTTYLAGRRFRKADRFIDEATFKLTPEDEALSEQQMKEIVDEEMPASIKRLTTMPKISAPRN